MKRHIDVIGITGVLALLALTVGCGDDGLTSPDTTTNTRMALPQAATIEVIPAALLIEPGEHYWLTAIIKDAEGQQLRGSHSIRWTSSNTDLVGISDEDTRVLVFARSSGAATVSAHYGTLSSSSLVTVRASAPGSEDQDGELEKEELEK